MDTREAGSMGGKKVLQTHGREYFKMLSLKGVAARKNKRKVRKSEDTLAINLSDKIEDGFWK